MFTVTCVYEYKDFYFILGTHPYIPEILAWWNLELLENKVMHENLDDRGQILKCMYCVRITEADFDIALLAACDIKFFVVTSALINGPLKVSSCDDSSPNLWKISTGRVYSISHFL